MKKIIIMNCPALGGDECRENSLISRKCKDYTDCIIKQIYLNKRADLLEVEDAE